LLKERGLFVKLNPTEVIAFVLGNLTMVDPKTYIDFQPRKEMKGLPPYSIIMPYTFLFNNGKLSPINGDNEGFVGETNIAACINTWNTIVKMPLRQYLVRSSNPNTISLGRGWRARFFLNPNLGGRWEDVHTGVMPSEHPEKVVPINSRRMQIVRS
jgi:hypothetical protein